MSHQLWRPLTQKRCVVLAKGRARCQRTVADERSAHASEVAALQRSLEDAQRQAFVQATQAAEAHRAELAAVEEMLAAVREGGAEARSQLQQAQAANAVRRATAKYKRRTIQGRLTSDTLQYW